MNQIKAVVVLAVLSLVSVDARAQTRCSTEHPEILFGVAAAFDVLGVGMAVAGSYDDSEAGTRLGTSSLIPFSFGTLALGLGFAFSVEHSGRCSVRGIDEMLPILHGSTYAAFGSINVGTVQDLLGSRASAERDAQAYVTQWEADLPTLNRLMASFRESHADVLAMAASTGLDEMQARQLRRDLVSFINDQIVPQVGELTVEILHALGERVGATRSSVIDIRTAPGLVIPGTGGSVSVTGDSLTFRF